MKRPTELIEKAKVFKSTDPIRVLAEYAVSLEQPRKTVSDDCEDDKWYDGKDWPEKEFEAEVARRKGEEWTHIDAFGDPCRIIADKPDSHGNVVILRQEGWYASAAASSVKPIKPTLSKDEAWDKAVNEDVSPFYILENYEVK